METNMANREVLTRSIALIAMTLCFWGCQQENDTQQALTESDIVRAVAKFINWNVNPNTHLEGIQKLSLNGTQAFDANYYGFDDGFDSGGDGTFLENGNQTLSFLYVVDSPSPINPLGQITANAPFADGSYPDQFAYTGIMYTVPITRSTVTAYDSAGQEIKAGVTYTREEVTDNSETGYPETAVQKQWDSSSDAQVVGSNTDTYTFSTINAGPHRNYYTATMTRRDASNNIVFMRTHTPLADKSPFESGYGYTDACYSDNGESLATTCGLGLNVAKITYRREDAGIISTRTTQYYDVNEKEVYRYVDTRTFASPARNHYTTRTIRNWNIDPATGEMTWNSGRDYTYDGAFVSSQTEYATESTVDWVDSYERDAQGREIGYRRKNAAGDSIWQKVYTTDSANRIAGIREYRFDEGFRNITPDCTKGSAIDYSWERGTDSSTTKTTLSYCDGGKYHPEPKSKGVIVYNAYGRETSYESYTIPSTGSYTLTYKQTRSYDTNGNLSKVQYYDVNATGEATAAGWVEYQYDHRKFLITTKTYDADGDLWDSSAAQKCTAGTVCFRTTSYTYR
jgi:hypothetical protein